MNIIKIAVSIGVIVPVMAINAKEKTPDITIENHSDVPITVFFRATGCANIAARRHYVCKAQIIRPNTGSSSYTWRWGQTGKEVSILAGPYIFKLNKKKLKGKYLWRGSERGDWKQDRVL